MRIYFFILFILTFSSNEITSSLINTYNTLVSFETLLPDIRKLPGWIPNGEFEIVSGQDLYMAINGGAEIYHEYGFRNALYQTYVNTEENYINLEIYEMESNAAAFGIYSFKRSITGSPIKLGFEGCLETYYLNFWKGNIVVTLTSSKTDSSLVGILINMAKIIDNKIISTSTPPELINLLPTKNLLSNGITYLRGKIAFINQDIFDSMDLFKLKEGIVGNYSDYKIMVIKYNNENESNNRFREVENILIKSKSYQSYRKNGLSFEVNKNNQEKFVIKPFLNFILVIQGNISLNSDKHFQLIEDNIHNFRKTG